MECAKPLGRGGKTQWIARSPGGRGQVGHLLGHQLRRDTQPGVLQEGGGEVQVFVGCIRMPQEGQGGFHLRRRIARLQVVSQGRRIGIDLLLGKVSAVCQQVFHGGLALRARYRFIRLRVLRHGPGQGCWLEQLLRRVLGD